MYVVLVTGGRGWTDPTPIRDLLAEVRTEALADAQARRLDRQDLVLRHGDCLGADRLAQAAGLALGYRSDPHPADWYGPCDPAVCEPGHRRLNRHGRPYCPAAGPRRNQHMVDLEPRPRVCLAFPAPGSRGTWQCVGAARAAGIEVRGPGMEHEPPFTLPLF